MSSHLPAVQLLTVVLALAGAGVALAGGVGLVAVVVRLQNGVSTAGTRRALGLWAVGALLLTAGTPGAIRGTLSGTPTVQSLAVVAVAGGVVAVVTAPLVLWATTIEDR